MAMTRSADETRLRVTRARAGDPTATQAALARHLGLSRSTVAAYDLGRTSVSVPSSTGVTAPASVSPSACAVHDVPSAKTARVDVRPYPQGPVRPDLTTGLQLSVEATGLRRKIYLHVNAGTSRSEIRERLGTAIDRESWDATEPVGTPTSISASTPDVRGGSSMVTWHADGLSTATHESGWNESRPTPQDPLEGLDAAIAACGADGKPTCEYCDARGTRRSSGVSGRWACKAHQLVADYDATRNAYQDRPAQVDSDGCVVLSGGPMSERLRCDACGTTMVAAYSGSEVCPLCVAPDAVSPCND